jgi:hypothetical protein
MRNIDDFQGFAAWYNLHLDLVRFANQTPNLPRLQQDGIYHLLISVLNLHEHFLRVGWAVDNQQLTKSNLPGLYHLAQGVRKGAERQAYVCLKAFEAVAKMSDGYLPQNIQQRLIMACPLAAAPSPQAEPVFV